MNKLGSWFKSSFASRQWGVGIGWAIFIILIAAILFDYYIFDPFIFGFSYYGIYILLRIGKLDTPEEMHKSSQRIISLCVIALLYMYIHLTGEVKEQQFIREVEHSCWSSLANSTKETQFLCDEIQNHIDSYLRPEPER